MNLIHETSESAKVSTLQGLNEVLRMEREENSRCFKYAQSLQRELDETRNLLLQKQIEVNGLTRHIEVICI